MIADRYRRLLDHLGPTTTLTTLRRSTASDQVALRHDIDHDLGVALDLSAVERRYGDRRATYFILHTHPYCVEPTFLDRLRRLVDDGHEIGLHLDAIGAWWRGETDDPIGDLARWLDRVRGAGIEIVAGAAHGAKACYEGGFANHWIWSDLRGDDPAAAMHGISAEGIPVDDPDFDLSTGRHQVLVHPWWWRDPRRTTFVLSTARTGTKWLCRRLETDSSALVLHERTLNQHGSTTEPAAGFKRTAGDLVGLLDDPPAVERLVLQSLTGHRRTHRDVVEANVYLPHVDPGLLAADDVSVVHLHRDPARVVRSVLQRGWYDTPDDRRHPRFDVEGWDDLTRVERACVYWAETNRRLLEAFPDAIRVAVEDLQRDPEAWRSFVTRLGLEPHDLRTADRDGPVDGTTAWTVPPVSAWPESDRRTFLACCGPVAAALGRSIELDAEPADAAVRVDARVDAPPDSTPDSTGVDSATTVLRVAGPGATFRVGRGRTSGCTWRRSSTRWWRARSTPWIVDGDGDGGGGAAVGLRRGAGWQGATPGRFQRRLPRKPVVSGELTWHASGLGFAGRLFAVEVDAAGRPLRRTPLLRIERGAGHGRFQRRLGSDALAVHPVVLVDAADGPWTLIVRHLDWTVGSLIAVSPGAPAEDRAARYIPSTPLSSSSS